MEPFVMSAALLLAYYCVRWSLDTNQAIVRTLMPQFDPNKLASEGLVLAAVWVENAFIFWLLEKI